ncbi:MAG: hypothetical protein OXF06_01475 [Bacteroidetes bacterium]|nr:hypothetical protein [Bacteroidota bacterium]
MALCTSSDDSVQIGSTGQIRCIEFNTPRLAPALKSLAGKVINCRLTGQSIAAEPVQTLEDQTGSAWID